MQQAQLRQVAPRARHTRQRGEGGTKDDDYDERGETGRFRAWGASAELNRSVLQTQGSPGLGSCRSSTLVGSSRVSTSPQAKQISDSLVPLLTARRFPHEGQSSSSSSANHWWRSKSGMTAMPLFDHAPSRVRSAMGRAAHFASGLAPAEAAYPQGGERGDGGEDATPLGAEDPKRRASRESEGCGTPRPL